MNSKSIGLIALVLVLFGCSRTTAVPESGAVSLCSGAGGAHAQYSATASNAMATLTATIKLPTAGFTVELRQRPERPLPPMYDFVCTPPSGIVAQVITTYTAATQVPGASAGDLIKVYDAQGDHRVTVDVAAAAQTGGVAEGQDCGGIAGIQCADGLYCAKEVGTCGVADGAGKCANKQQVCPAVEAPVCGCDGQRYGNECKAATVGVNVDHVGECR